MKLSYCGYLYESINNNVLISVDIQPEYKNYMSFKPYQFTDWLNNNYSNFNSILFLFNGPELGFPTKGEYINWLLEEGLSEDIIDNIEFFDKGYAFFRSAMDAGMNENDILKIIQYMVANDINDSRDIEDWSTLNISEDDIDRLSVDPINIPDVMEKLGNINGNISLVGGGRYECLAEVELCLKAKNKSYNLIEDFIY